ncbi:HD domain-containing protein [Truepera radiovictrix]|uniref:Response regulator receiver protein n=1 Tax=Truepera radiovictrix (strain DSM 17093 / CIP 108686 / LMG 22925 / RQ-24) TaxID=649638 RepID=D7CXI1_TRURR|nr:HD domain-containing protein [Truepera radiovictrix]ADI14583.1 response regulator receiver protein [Truepera radiovictrix DSM 17093]WMT56867.1 HD domain-containing protein [Truepera radiovictrix]
MTWFFLDGAPPRLVSTLWRTAQAFVPRLARADDAFAARVLPRAEYALYRRMDVRDRAHACGVARALLTLEPAAPSTLLRAALLHDVGKSGRRYRPLERILVALYTPRALPHAPRLRGLRGAWQRRRHHPRYGAELILAAGGDPRVAELVARHHHPAGDPEAELLRRADARF